MPRRGAVLNTGGAAAHILQGSFRPAAADRVGIEIEMLPVSGDGRRADHRQVADIVATLGPLASGTAITFEPGGQLAS
ncbi:MAG: hypothetical protein ACRD1K_12495 [Acidimicrobiales bacterium]